MRVKLRFIVSLATLVAANCLLAGTALAVTIAQTGFNDASGINSDVTANSPYQAGSTVIGKGVGEPGWTNSWFQTGSTTGPGIASTTRVQEGDLSLQIQTTGTGVGTNATQIARNFTTQTSGIVKMDIQVNVDDFAGRPIAFYLYNAANTRQTAVITLAADGSIDAVGGNGTGGTVVTADVFPNGTVTLDTWHRIEMFADLATQKFNFRIDGGTLSNDFFFRQTGGAGGAITDIGLFQINHGLPSTTSAFYDSLVISQVPEPSGMIIAGCSIGAVAIMRRRIGKRTAEKG